MNRKFTILVPNNNIQFASLVVSKFSVSGIFGGGFTCEAKSNYTTEVTFKCKFFKVLECKEHLRAMEKRDILVVLREPAN